MTVKILETKVLAGAAGAGAGGALAQFMLWLLGVLAWHQSADAASSSAAVAAIPTPVATIIVLLAAAAGSWLAGYAAPHTSRPDLAPTPVVPDLPASFAHPAPVVTPAPVDPTVPPVA